MSAHWEEKTVQGRQPNTDIFADGFSDHYNYNWVGYLNTPQMPSSQTHEDTTKLVCKHFNMQPVPPTSSIFVSCFWDNAVALGSLSRCAQSQF
jgi:hypothetical protein